MDGTSGKVWSPHDLRNFILSMGQAAADGMQLPTLHKSFKVLPLTGANVKKSLETYFGRNIRQVMVPT